MTNSIFQFIPEILSLSTLSFSFLSLILITKYLGKSGLYTYSAIATIASNIQVLKLTQYHLMADPIALGTVLFSTTFAVDNILTEYYGAKAAKKGLYISFFNYLFFVVVMQITVWHPVVQNNDCVNLHAELKQIFSPGFSIFISSLAAFFAGQYTDIFICSNLKRLSKGKYQAIRSMISMALAAFVDNCVFSFFAWIIFAENPVSLSVLWQTYIFVNYILRLIIAMMCVPLVKLVKRFVVEKTDV